MKYNLENSFDVERAKTYFNKLLSDKSKIEIIKNREVRTIKQNAYLHVCITLFGINFGYTIEEAKTHLKRTCNFMTYEKNNEKFLRKTSELDTLELTVFIDWIRNYSSDNGCYIPDANEYLMNKFEIDKEIEKNNLHL